jgi:hypothetical protein
LVFLGNKRVLKSMDLLINVGITTMVAKITSMHPR